MGLVNYLTSDTNQSISNINSGAPSTAVYLLQPNGAQPIREDAYEGYGFFGAVNCFEWLVRNNADDLGLDLEIYCDDEIALLGVGLDCGEVYKVVKTGEHLSIFNDYTALVAGRYLAITFDKPVPGFGRSANDLIESGELEAIELKSAVSLKLPHSFV